METALFHYGYSDRSPAEWNITIDKNVSRNRTNIDYPFVKAYRVEPSLVTLGETKDKLILSMFASMTVTVPSVMYCGI